MTRSADRFRRRRQTDETGSALAGVVVSLLVLGILVAGAVVAVDSLAGNGTPAGPSHNPATYSAVVACETDYASVQQAESAYQAQVGRYPASVAALAVADPATGTGPWLKQAPSSTRYILVIDPSTGAIGVEDPAGRPVSSCASLG